MSSWCILVFFHHFRIFDQLVPSHINQCRNHLYKWHPHINSSRFDCITFNQALMGTPRYMSEVTFWFGFPYSSMLLLMLHKIFTHYGVMFAPIAETKYTWNFSDVHVFGISSLCLPLRCFPIHTFSLFIIKNIGYICVWVNSMG